MEHLESLENVNYFKVFMKSIMIAFFSTLLLILILSILITYTSLREEIIKPAVIFISAFSILLGGFLVSRKIMKKGIIYGGILGLIYMILIYIISGIIGNNFIIGLSSCVMIVSGIMGGAIGGILGVNLK